jgi:hypothetical protein
MLTSVRPPTPAAHPAPRDLATHFIAIVVAIVTAVVPLAGCSGGSSGGGGEQGTVNPGGSGSGSGSSTTGDDNGPSSNGDAASAFDGANWACPSSLVFGEYSDTCVSCLENMCSSQLSQCVSNDCATCEGPVFSCETQSCSDACAIDGGNSGGVPDDAGGAATGSEGGTTTGTGSCAGLMTCCGFVAMVSATEAADCTSVAQSGNETSCQQVISMLGQLATYCQ